MSAFKGVTVTVYRPSDEVDAHGNRVAQYTTETVTPVLANPNATAEQRDAVQPYGARVSGVLAFPKTYTASLAGCLVEVPGWPGRFEVIGDPLPVVHDCPTKWNRKVLIMRSDG